MINKEIISNHIDLRLRTNLKEIKSDENGKVKSIIIEETGEEIPCNVVGLTAGVTPNIDFIKDSKIETNRGVISQSIFRNQYPRYLCNWRLCRTT